MFNSRKFDSDRTPVGRSTTQLQYRRLVSKYIVFVFIVFRSQCDLICLSSIWNEILFFQLKKWLTGMRKFCALAKKRKIDQDLRSSEGKVLNCCEIPSSTQQINMVCKTWKMFQSWQKSNWLKYYCFNMHKFACKK